MNSSNPRVAQPDDIFILLVPTAQELHHIHHWQAQLQNQYGGQPVEHIHITCQRFTPRETQDEFLCIEALKEKLTQFSPFIIYTDKLLQFHAPYWQTDVIRWRVQETDDYAEFRDQLETTLQNIRCPSHFNRLRHATCTALNTNRRIQMDEKQFDIGLPQPLFTAKKLVISQLKETGQFEILETLFLV